MAWNQCLDCAKATAVFYVLPLVAPDGEVLSPGYLSRDVFCDDHWAPDLRPSGVRYRSMWTRGGVVKAKEEA